MAEGVALHQLVTDSDGRLVDYRIVDVNPEFERIIGLPRAEAAGKLATEVYGSPEPPFLAEYGKVGQSGVATAVLRSTSPL